MDPTDTRYDAAWFESALDAMTDMVLIKGDRSRLLWANRAFREYYGLTNEQLAELIDAKHSDPDDTIQYVRDDHHVFTTGERLCMTEPVTRADGEVQYFETIKTAIYDGLGQSPARTIGVSRPVSNVVDVETSASERNARKTKVEVLRELVTTIPVPVVVVDAQSRVVASSDEFRALFAIDEGTGRSFEDVFAETSGIARAMSDAIDHAHTAELRDVAVVIEDTNRWIDLEIRPWQLPTDQTGGAIVVVTDVTELRSSERRLAALNAQLERSNEALERAQEDLAKKNSHLNAVLDAITVGVIVADHDGTFTLWNKEARTILAMGPQDGPRSQWAGTYGLHDPSERLLAPDEVPLHRALNGATVINEDILVRNANIEGDRWIRMSAHPVEGDVERNAIVVFNDTTAQVESQRELEEFAYVASHDLQEPLRMVRNYVKLLEEEYGDRIDGDGLHYMRFAVDGADRMQRLIRDLLAYSRQGQRELDLEPVDLDALLRNVIEDLQVVIAEQDASVEILPLGTVVADSGQLRQLFFNLIANAIKFRDPARSPKVVVSCDRTAAGPRLTVSDNGIGIDAKYASKVFKMFQRLHPYGVYPGTGIGLAICKRIVARHGGTIGFNPTPNGGTTFWFSIVAPTEPAEPAMTGGRQ